MRMTFEDAKRVHEDAARTGQLKDWEESIAAWKVIQTNEYKYLAPEQHCEVWFHAAFAYENLAERYHASGHPEQASKHWKLAGIGYRQVANAQKSDELWQKAEACFSFAGAIAEAEAARQHAFQRPVEVSPPQQTQWRVSYASRPTQYPRLQFLRPPAPTPTDPQNSSLQLIFR